MTIIEQIRELHHNIHYHRICIRDMEARLQQLQASRGDCEHSFTPPLEGYEHEGGVCNKCGIGEVHAAHIAANKQT